jgi:hypothetical protein
MPEVIGGMGAMDSIVTVDPDPQADLKHVSDAMAGVMVVVENRPACLAPLQMSCAC